MTSPGLMDLSARMMKPLTRLAKTFCRPNPSPRQGLHGRHVAAARHDDIGFGTLVVTGPIPDTGTLGAVRHGWLHVQILQVHLFVRHDDVDIVDAAQAVIGHGQQAVGVGRQIDAHHVEGFC
jgi:hypothetical protein